MTTDATLEIAREIPEHQTNRGSEFREISVQERKTMARLLNIARVQATASNADWDDRAFRRTMMRKRLDYMYECGQLGVDVTEARAIWWSVVYDGATPHQRRDLV
jgi:hypothetical protein